MRSVSKAALGAMFAFAALGSTPLAAQQAVALSREERAALRALNTALEARDYAAATRALDGAQNSARSNYARYLASALQYKLGLETNNVGLQQTAIDAMIGSGATPAGELPQLYRNQGALAESAGKYERAEAAYARWTEAAPNDHDALLALANIKNTRKKPQEAVTLLDRAIAARRAAGQPVPEAWYKRGLAIAFANQMPAATTGFARGLVGAYPTPANWRDVVLVYRDTARPDPDATLDSWRLLRSAKGLAGERDYLEFAQALDGSGQRGEAKSVLDEGVAAKMVDPAKPVFKELIAASGKGATAGRAALPGLQAKAGSGATGSAALAAANAYFGYGDYAKAVPLYQAALQKGSVDANLVNSRLGMALALTGQQGEASTALRAVTGPRAELASLWLVWLGQRG